MVRTYNIGEITSSSIKCTDRPHGLLEWITGAPKKTDIQISITGPLHDNNITTGDKIVAGDGNEFTVSDISAKTVTYTSLYIYRVCGVGGNVGRIKAIFSSYRPTDTVLVRKKTTDH